MNTISMNSKNSKTPNRHKLLLSGTEKKILRASYKFVALSNLSLYYLWKNIKKSSKNKIFKISAPTWN